MPNPKKQKTTPTSVPIHTQRNLVEWGEKADASNLERGLLSFPVELTTEILDYFPAIGPYTSVNSNNGYPILPEIFHVRIDVLRALSQVCIDYRRAFLPLLWESINVCFTTIGPTTTFYKHVGEGLVRKCDGLSANPNLASYIGTVRVVLTRYQTPIVIPKFSSLLSSLQNLHTLHVFHAHNQMTTAIKDGFQGIELPRLRTAIIPGHCHEILKCCPEVTKVWCNHGDGSKLVTVIGKSCKKVQEMRGFSSKEKLVKRIIKAAPNLRVLEIHGLNFEPMVNALSSFKDINTIIINSHGVNPNQCIEATKQKLKNLAPPKERRYIRVWHQSNDRDFQYYWENGKTDINAYVRDYYSEVPI